MTSGIVLATCFETWIIPQCLAEAKMLMLTHHARKRSLFLKCFHMVEILKGAGCQRLVRAERLAARGLVTDWTWVIFWAQGEKERNIVSVNMSHSSTVGFSACACSIHPERHWPLVGLSHRKMQHSRRPFSPLLFCHLFWGDIRLIFLKRSGNFFSSRMHSLCFDSYYWICTFHSYVVVQSFRP